MEAVNFRVYPISKDQLDAIQTVFRAFKIKFELESSENYNPEFVKRVLEAKEEIKQGKGEKIAIEDLWK